MSQNLNKDVNDIRRRATLAVELVGCEFVGIQIGFGIIGDQAVFNDPQTHTGVCVPLAGISSDTCLVARDRSRAKFAQQGPSAAAEQEKTKP